MLMLTDPPKNGLAAHSGRPGVPRGPRGLWGALAQASAPSVVARALPVIDTALIGVAVGTTMFDYDPLLATSLGEESDPRSLLS
jgi:hypothetical protein